MSEKRVLLTVFSHLESDDTIRQHVINLSDAKRFEVFFRDVDRSTAALEPDANAILSDPHSTTLRLRRIRAIQIRHVIRVAFYDVRVTGAPILALDGVGIRASSVAVTTSRIFVRAVLRNALSPHQRANPGPQRLDGPPVAEEDFFGTVFAAGLNAAVQDIDIGDATKTTALLEGVQVADKYLADPASPAWYRPRPASPSPNLPDTPIAPNTPDVRPVRPPITGPRGPFDRRLNPAQNEPEVSSSGGGRFGIAPALVLGLRKGIQLVQAKVKEARQPRVWLRVADLPGSYRDGEAPPWFPVGPFVGAASIPFAETLGIDQDLTSAGLFAYVGSPLDNGAADEPHWTRRLRVTFERGPPLPQNVSVRTIELAFTRAFHTKRNVVFGNSELGTAKAQLPVSLSLRARRRDLNLVREFLTTDGRTLTCQFDGTQYRFVQRQPSLWCAERPAVSDPIPFLVAIEEVDFKDIARMWNRDVAGRYYGAVASTRNERRLSFFPQFVPGADNEAPDEDLPSDTKADLSTVLGGSNSRFSIIFGLSDRSEMFGERQRFVGQVAGREGLTPTLWRIEPGPLRNAVDRALRLLFDGSDTQAELSRAAGDELIADVITKISRQQDPASTFRPERLHFRRTLSTNLPELVNAELERLCRGVGDLSSVLGLDALLEANPNTDLISEDGKPPPTFDPEKSWSDIAALSGATKLATEFVTELFRDTEGNALTWQSEFDFLAPPVSDGGTSGPDNRLRLVDLRVFAGLGDRTRPTGYRDDAGPTRPAFFAFTLNAVTLQSGELGEPRVSRLGAYDITFVKTNPAEIIGEQGGVAVWLAPVDYRGNGDAGAFLAHAEVTMTVDVQTLTPGTQDDIEGADLTTATAPLLIPLVDNMDREESRDRNDLRMRVTERAYHLTKQQVRLELRSQSGIPASEVVVFDQQPLLVAKVTMGRIEGTGENAVVASWESDASLSPTWRVAKQAAGYDLVLPSASVGESVARDNPGQTDAFGLREYELADFRFSPPVRLRLGTDPRFALRNEVEPPFNTRRIFGTANDRAPFGAPLFEASFELLYGLTAKVRGGPGQELRELGSDIGRPPRRFDAGGEVGRNRLFAEKRPKIAEAQQQNRKRFRTGWSDVVTRLESRPAVLSLRRGGTLADGPLSDGVSFSLRQSADIAAPVDLDGDFGQTPYALNRPRHSSNRVADWQDEDSNLHPPLEGGADAGFQSANIYRELWRNPDSDSGELTGVSFTALGAGGAQRATFASGKQRIISKSSQGRTHYYSLERIGRIGCYWNKAKHVVVFERTVSPTKQFEYPMRVGSPTLRKVREYVEILQPYRPFPEDGAQSQRAGAVRGLRFDEVIIPVDSAWGNDVGRYGWQVPLYQVGALGYVPPPIDFELAIDPRGGNDARLVRSRTPERFVFYTSTLDSDGENSDEWPRVPGVDAPLRPVPRPRPILTHLPENIDAPLPDEEEISLGFEPFTHEIDTSEGPPIDLGARRTGKPMVATLKNLTVTRGALPTLAPNINVGGESVNVGGLMTDVQNARAAARDAISGISQILDDVSELDADGVEDLFNRKRDQLKRRFIGGQLEKKIGKAVEFISDDDLSEVFSNPGNALCGRVDREVETISKRLQEAVNNQSAELRGELDAVIAIADGGMAKLEGPVRRLQRLLADLRQKERVSIEAALDDLNRLRTLVYNEVVNVAGRPQIGTQPELNGVIDDVASLVGNVFPNSRTPLHLVLKELPDISLISTEAILAPVDLVRNELKRANRLTADIRASGATARRGVAQTRKVVTTAKRALDRFSRATPIKGLSGASEFVGTTRRSINILDRKLAKTVAEIDSIESQASGSFEDILNLFDSVLAKITASDSPIREAIDDANKQIELLRRAVSALKTGNPLPKQSDGYPLNAAIDEINSAINAVNSVGINVEEARSTGLKLLTDAKTSVRLLEKALRDEITLPDSITDEFWNALSAPLNAAERRLSQARNEAFPRGQNGSYRLSQKIVSELQGKILEISRGADSAVSQFCKNNVAKGLNDAANAAKEFLESLSGEIPFETYFDQSREKLRDLLSNIGNLADVKDVLDDAIANVDGLTDRALGFLEESIVSEIEGDLDAIFNTGDTAVRLYRAFGDAPTVPSLGFNRESLGYFFDDPTRIDTTPTAALFDRLGDDLKGLGLRVPTTGLTERLLPKFDDNFKIGDLFPDIGGIKLDKLLERALLPNFAKDYVNITHGIDKETRTGWIDANVSPIQVNGAEPLFELFGLAVTLRDGNFSGSARQEIGLEGQQRSEGQGKIEGDWALAFGGKDLVTFVNTPLAFDQSGEFDFGVRPENVRLAPELSFIDKFLNSNPLIGGTGNEGFTVGILQEGLLPVGVECLLDLPIPPMVYGTTGVSGLRLIAGMQLRVVPEFSITVHAAIGSIETPFTITIFILGGTGWIQTWGRYVPSTGEMQTSVSLAIGASAMLGFSFGPINGSVQIVVAIKAQLITSNQTRDQLSISLLIICTGQVNVAGLISASLLLVMELRFADQGRTITGTGTVSFRIKISRFFTYRISQSVTYTFKGNPNPPSEGQQKHVGAVA